MASQGSLFDQTPHVIIFPIRTLGWAEALAGQGYEAIALCQIGDCAIRIGMNRVTLLEAELATVPKIKMANHLTAEICTFLAHSVLQKTEEQVDEYQNADDKKSCNLPLGKTRVHSKSPRQATFKSCFQNCLSSP